MQIIMTYADDTNTCNINGLFTLVNSSLVGFKGQSTVACLGSHQQTAL